MTSYISKCDVIYLVEDEPRLNTSLGSEFRNNLHTATATFFTSAEVQATTTSGATNDQ